MRHGDGIARLVVLLEPPPRRRRAAGWSTRCSSPSPWPVSTRAGSRSSPATSATRPRPRTGTGRESTPSSTAPRRSPSRSRSTRRSRSTPFGPARLLARLRRAGSDPHFVHVSTAYVADRRSGRVDEDGLPHHAIDGARPRAAPGARRGSGGRTVEAESRADPLSSGFAKAAQRDAAERQGLDPGERAEELRAAVGAARSSRGGAAAAPSELGWPDTYALSKALGERLLTEHLRPDHDRAADDHRVGAGAAAAGLARGDQGRRPADPRLRRRAASPTCPGGPPTGSTSSPSTRRQRLRRRRRPPARGESCARSRSPAAPATRWRSASWPSTSANTSAPTRCRARQRQADQDRRAQVRRAPGGAAARRCGASGSPPRSPARRSPRRSASPRSGCCAATPSLAERVTRMVKIYGAYTELDCVFDDSNACELAALAARGRPRRAPLRHGGDRLGGLPAAGPPAPGASARHRRMAMSPRTAVVTGASSGIGAATARALAGDGFHVLARRPAAGAARGAAPTRSAARRSPSTSPTRPRSRPSPPASTSCDVLVNNAGGALGLEAVAESDEERWRWMYEANVLGTMRMTRALLPALIASGDGLWSASPASPPSRPTVAAPATSAAKHAQRAMLRSLRLELLGAAGEDHRGGAGDGRDRVLAGPLRRRRGGRRRASTRGSSRSRPPTSPSASAGSPRCRPTSTSTRSSSGPAPRRRRPRCTAPDRLRAVLVRDRGKAGGS